MASTGAALRPAIAPKRRALSVVLHPAVADLLAIVAVLLAALPAIWPLTRFRFLSSHDGTYHLLRLVEFDRLVRQGELFPGWFPTFASGYGYPLLSYYPPLSYFPAEILHLLGLGYVDAVKAALALPILLSGVGAYLLGRDILGSRLGGWLTAVAFMYAPYHLIDTYVRAILSESWVFPFLPLLLWSLRRAAAGSLRQVGLAALWWAGLILAHNVIALFFTPLALLFGLLMVGTAPDRKQAAMRVVGAFGLALTVSAAYWLPALAENGFVSTSNFNTTLYRPEEHLNALDEIVSTDLLHEYAQSPFRFGLIQVALALAGLAAWPWARGRRVGIAYAAGLAILFCALLTSLLVFVWSVLPLIAFVQFPTRLLAIAALGTGILTGAVALFPAPLRWFGLFGAAALVVSGVARIDPPPLWPQDADLTGATIARFEHDSGIIGTTTAAEYLPAWSRAGFVPPTEGFAEPVGTANDPALAARVRAAGPLSLSLDVTAAQPAPLRLHVFFFPGWTARIDGQSVPIRPTTKLGLLTVDVPAGTHQVDLSFGPTALRLASLLVSLVGLSVVGLLVVGVGGTLAFGGALIVLLLGARLAGEAGALRWSMIPPVDGSPVSLAGGRLRSQGSDAEVELFWLAQDEGVPDRRFGVRLVDPAGAIVAEKWGRPIFDTSTTEAWHRNEIVRDPRILHLPPGHPGGAFGVEIAAASGQWRSAGELVLSAARPALPPPSIARTASFGDLVRLDGLSLSVGDRVARPVDRYDAIGAAGETIDLRLRWTPTGDFDESYTVFAHLIDPQGKRVAQQDNQPSGGFSPTTGWQRGIPVEDGYRLRLPADAGPGIYRVEVGWYLLADLERLPLDGGPASALTVARVRVPGPVERPSAGVHFGERIVLMDAVRDGEHLRLTWQLLDAGGPPVEVFVHVRDQDGRIVRQADGAPLGDYPFSLWSVGEVVRETRLVGTLPPGGSIVVGVYAPQTGMRLLTPEGQDFVVAR